MNRTTTWVSLALTCLVLLGLPLPAVAQGGARDQVPFKLTVAGPRTSWFVIPMEPPMASANLTWTGDILLFGQSTVTTHILYQLGLDGKPVSFTGVSALTAANGDAIFGTFTGLKRATANPNVLASEAAFTITGGKGRFAGATGIGVQRGEVDFVKNTWTYTFEGTVSRPR